jgi:serine/threonine-protein kinase RsbW
MNPELTTSEAPPKGLEMRLPARPENVAVIRHALAGLAEEIGMDDPGIADLKTVVTEACMNVAVHAYEGRPGPLSVEAEPDAEGLTVIVRDSGIGIRPRPDAEQTSLKLGLSLIAALCSSFSFSGGLNRGTEIEMRLPLEGGGAEVGGPPFEVELPADRTELSVARSELLGPILSRIVGALAARRDLPIDRVSDAILLTDAIALAAPGNFADERVLLSISDADQGVELRLGPMREGGAERVREALTLPEVGGSLEALADAVAVEGDADGDYLAIRFSSPSPAP